MFRFRMLFCLTLMTLTLLFAACSQKEENRRATNSNHSEQTAPATGSKKGKEIYERVCFSCHGTGVAGAPKLGDQAAWKDRIAKGTDALVQSAMNGKGNMPPKGGERSLSEDDIRAAVGYMIDQAR